MKKIILGSVIACLAILPVTVNAQLNPKIVKLISAAEENLQIDLKVTSGVRDHSDNVRVGGAENSSHLRGLAVDVRMPRNGWRPLVAFLQSKGVKRIGIYKHHIHFDVDDSKPYQGIWKKF